MPNWENIFNMVMPAVITLEKIAEAWFTRPKSGKQKKEFVHKGVMEIFKSAENITTGGAHHTVQVLEQHLPELIDTTAGVVFAAKKRAEEEEEEKEEEAIHMYKHE
jgi:gas vesicle protein